MTIFAYCQLHSLSADYTFPIVFLFSSLSFNGRPTKLRLPVIIMTFGNVFGTDLTFSNFLTSFSPGIDHDPHVFSMIIWLMFIHFFMFHSSHDHVAKRSHYRAMIFSTSEYYSTDTSPPSFPSISSTTPPSLYSPSTSINDRPIWRSTPPRWDVWSNGRSRE